jgi:hypothetical protein
MIARVEVSPRQNVNAAAAVGQDAARMGALAQRGPVQQTDDDHLSTPTPGQRIAAL